MERTDDGRRYDRRMGAGDVWQIIGIAVALAAAAFAGWQAWEAGKARREAQQSGADAAARAHEANAALSSIAAAQLAIAKAHRPSAWGDLKKLAGDGWAIRNTSGRAIVLRRVEIDPVDAQTLLHVTLPFPQTLSNGGIFQFSIGSRITLRATKVTLVWHFSDEPATDEHSSERLLH